jgi:hypothetical protein
MSLTHHNQTAAPAHWSRQPKPDLVGVSVCQNQHQFSLRFHLRTQHLDRLGDDAKRIGIRGSAENGFILTPDDKGLKPSRIAKTDLHYLTQTVAKFDLSKRERRTVWIRVEFENGHLRIPPLPPAWINVEAEFEPGSAFEEGKCVMAVSRNGGDDPVRISSKSRPISSPTVPPPKPSPQYQIPQDADIVRLQTDLAYKLDEARSIIQNIERLSGLRFALDRNLRLVVLLPT